jgi:hypothetical protein
VIAVCLYAIIQLRCLLAKENGWFLISFINFVSHHELAKVELGKLEEP